LSQIRHLLPVSQRITGRNGRYAAYNLAIGTAHDSVATLEGGHRANGRQSGLGQGQAGAYLFQTTLHGLF
jgi:hypothetical protein